MTTTEATPTEQTQDGPNENLILNAEAYPFNDELMSLHLMYSDGTPGQNGSNFKSGQFLIRKTDAESLAKSISVVMTAPDTQTAWETISASIEEHDPEWDGEDA